MVSCRSCTKIDFPTDTKSKKNGRRNSPAVDMPIDIRYILSNRLIAKNRKSFLQRFLHTLHTEGGTKDEACWSNYLCTIFSNHTCTEPYL